MNESHSAAIHVASLRKTYGRTVAVDGVSFDVQPGEIFGLIGPNGAGKTTTMECVEGLRTAGPGYGSFPPRARSGARRLRVAAEDRRATAAGAAPRSASPSSEAVGLWASLYRTPAADANRLIEQLGLADKRDAWFMTLSGGQKQRLFIALALVNDPELVFLDEPTTGLDPGARRAVWDWRGMRDRGRDVIVTTHLMEEAERLCDRLAIIDRGPHDRHRHPGRSSIAPSLVPNARC